MGYLASPIFCTPAQNILEYLAPPVWNILRIFGTPSGKNVPLIELHLALIMARFFFNCTKKMSCAVRLFDTLNQNLFYIKSLHDININIMDYSNSNKDREATKDYYSSKDDGEATKKNEDYYSSEDDGEATKKNEDYYSSEDDGETSKKNEDYYSDGGEDEGGANPATPKKTKKEQRRRPTTRS